MDRRRPEDLVFVLGPELRDNCDSPPHELLSVREVLVYDDSEQTYCCEITPSHWMLPVAMRFEWSADAPDRMVEEWEMDLGGREEGKYVHVSTVQSWPLLHAIHLRPGIDRRKYLNMPEMSEIGRALADAPVPRATWKDLQTLQGRLLLAHLGLLTRGEGV